LITSMSCNKFYNLLKPRSKGKFIVKFLALGSFQVQDLHLALENHHQVLDLICPIAQERHNHVALTSQDCNKVTFLLPWPTHSNHLQLLLLPPPLMTTLTNSSRILSQQLLMLRLSSLVQMFY